MNKLRLSYTFVNLWDRGMVDDAISTYFHLNDKEPTRQMKEGSEMHEAIAGTIDSTGQFPNWFFKGQLKDPEPEKEVIVSYNEQFDFKGIFDCVDDGILYEYKSGVSTSSDWARQMQVPIYFLLAEIAEIDIKSCYLIHYNQYIKKSDFVIIHNGKEMRDKARNWIDSLAPEIYEHFVRENLI